MEDGSFVESSVIKAVIQGEARVGKTSFKCMLSNDKYTDNRSTNCIESPCVAIKCYGHTGKWEHYDEERMEVTVIAEIHSRAEKHAKKVVLQFQKAKLRVSQNRIIKREAPLIPHPPNEEMCYLLLQYN